MGCVLPTCKAVSLAFSLNTTNSTPHHHLNCLRRSATQQQQPQCAQLAVAAAALGAAALLWKAAAGRAACANGASGANGAGAGRQRCLEPWPEIPRPDADPKAYQLALARTRQALDVQKAVTFMKAGEPARAMVELHRALEENAVCRSPLLDGHQTRGELRDLYKLHLLNTPVPHSFATLLQLRELLGIAPGEAEDIEVAVLEAGSAFSI